jgi:2,3-bisphosphoglycerate-dependent phosphoglycerate mutase
VRHGQSLWNVENLFTGWTDVELSELGRAEAAQAGRELLRERLEVDVAFTSVLKRAIRTLWLMLDEMERMWVPVERSWRLNERHYGALQGRNKKETRERYGDELFQQWRRSFDVRPPALESDDAASPAHDPRYRDVPPEALPATECLADVVRRVVPYWEDDIVPDLLETAGRGGAVLVVAHGNSIRALRKHLEHMSDEEIVGLEIPTGIPWRCRLDEEFEITSAGYLGDPDEARAAAERVAKQAV